MVLLWGFSLSSVNHCLFALPCLTWSLEPLHPVSAEWSTFYDGSRWMGCLLVALLQELLCTIIAECRAFDCFFLSMDKGSINVCLFVAT